MEFNAKIKSISDIRSGLKKDETSWYLRDITLIIPETYTGFYGEEKITEHELIVTLNGEEARDIPLQIGDDVTAYISFSTHEFNGRVYQNINCRKLLRRAVATETA